MRAHRLVDLTTLVVSCHRVRRCHRRRRGRGSVFCFDAFGVGLLAAATAAQLVTVVTFGGEGGGGRGVGRQQVERTRHS